MGEHRAGVADHNYPLMMLAGIELWHRIFIDPPETAKPQLDLSAYSVGYGFAVPPIRDTPNQQGPLIS
jgi:hypothetical protein